MKSIFERLIDRFKRRSSDRDGNEPSTPPSTSQEMRGAGTAPEDPYAEMRKALAMTMLLG